MTAKDIKIGREYIYVRPGSDPKMVKVLEKDAAGDCIVQYRDGTTGLLNSSILKKYATYDDVGKRVGALLVEYNVSVGIFTRTGASIIEGVLDSIDASGAYWVYTEENDEVEQIPTYERVWLLD